MSRTGLLQGVDRWHYVPDGVASLDETRVYIADAHGGITALAVADGALLWSSTEAGVPLIGLNGALLAASGSRLCCLDETSGALLDTASDPLPMSSESPVEVWRDGERILITWKTSEGDEGVAALDVPSGRVSVAEPRREVAGPPGDLTLFRSYGDRPATWRAGDRMAALATGVSRGQERLRLVTWNAAGGGSVKEKELVRALPRSGYLSHHHSPDVHHIYLMSCNDRQEGEYPAGLLCRWRVFRVRDGKQIAAFPTLPEIEPPLAVAGNRLFFVDGGYVPRKKAAPLRRFYALDLATGELAWSHPIGRAGRNA